MTSKSGFGPPRDTVFTDALEMSAGQFAHIVDESYDRQGSVWRLAGTTFKVCPSHDRQDLDDLEVDGLNSYELGAVVSTNAGTYRRKSDGHWEAIMPVELDEQPTPTVDWEPQGGDRYTDKRADAATYLYDDGSWDLILED